MAAGSYPFPKSHDVSKAIDRESQAQRQVVGYAPGGNGLPPGHLNNSGGSLVGGKSPVGLRPVTAPATAAAAHWNGWGTALKPSHEPIILARRPLTGTVAMNVLAHGTGALNIDACRVVGPAGNGHWARNGEMGTHGIYGVGGQPGGDFGKLNPAGARWPPNILLGHASDCNGECASGCPVAELNQQSGNVGAAAPVRGDEPSAVADTVYGHRARITGVFNNDSAGAARFFPCFRYQAKAPARERPRLGDGTAWPTVKPLGLMRWLVRLVTPPSGLVLDPFAGTGTTAEACVAEGFQCVLVERDLTAIALIRERFSKDTQAGTLF
jgi:hypothetical protein